MQFLLLARVWLASMVPIALITEPVFAFQLRGTTASSSQESYVTIPDTGDSGKITVTTKDIKEIKRGGSDALLDLLRPYEQQGWKFKQGGNLGGAFNVISYYPCDPITQCGKEQSIFPELGITRVTELKAAEIDSIRFESIMPEPVLTLPKKQPDTNGVIALGHVPRLLAGAVDAELGRATELTSFESTHSNIDSNAVERNGIRLEILVPDRVWRIPEKQDATTPVRIGFQITNNTPYPIRFPPLDPLLVFPLEIVDVDGNLLRRSGGRGMLLKSPQLACPLVQPRESLTFFLKAELFWQNNQLLFGGNDGLGGGWTFRIGPGNYQIRLAYVNSRALLFCDEPQTGMMTNLTRGIWTGQIVTPFVKFRVLQSESK
jgi:hypothetical protein